MLYYRIVEEYDERVIVDENGRIVIFTAEPGSVGMVLCSTGEAYRDSNPLDYTAIMELWGSVRHDMDDSTSLPGSWELEYGENVYYVNQTTYDITPRPSTEYPG